MGKMKDPSSEASGTSAAGTPKGRPINPAPFSLAEHSNSVKSPARLRVASQPGPCKDFESIQNSVNSAAPQNPVAPEKPSESQSINPRRRRCCRKRRLFRRLFVLALIVALAFACCTICKQHKKIKRMQESGFNPDYEGFGPHHHFEGGHHHSPGDHPHLSRFQQMKDDMQKGFDHLSNKIDELQGQLSSQKLGVATPKSQDDSKDVKVMKEYIRQLENEVQKRDDYIAKLVKKYDENMAQATAEKDQNIAQLVARQDSLQYLKQKLLERNKELTKKLNDLQDHTEEERAQDESSEEPQDKSNEPKSQDEFNEKCQAEPESKGSSRDKKKKAEEILREGAKKAEEILKKGKEKAKKAYEFGRKKAKSALDWVQDLQSFKDYKSDP